MTDARDEGDMAGLMARLHGLTADAGGGSGGNGGSGRIEALLKARARRLAQPRGHVEARADIRVLCVALASERYAVPLDSLSEVMPLASWTPVPGQPQYLLGVTNLRGEIRPVLNLHSLLSLEEPSDESPCWVVFVKAPAGEVGLRVNAVDQVRGLDPAGLTNPRESGNGLPQRLVAGITSDSLILLDVPQILAVDVLNDGRAAAGVP